MSIRTDRGNDSRAEALSTRPEELVEPAEGSRGAQSLRVRLRQGWRRLTSMRTALQLLFLLSLAAVPGGLLPQRGQELQHVNTYLATHRTLGPILDRLSLFDVFKSPWFAAIYVLLFISLVGCLTPRIRLHAKALRRQPPSTPARLDRLPGGFSSYVTETSPDEVLGAARPLLRGWRIADRGSSLSAEKGYSRETGNLLFHVSLVVLLIGVGIGSLFGYEGDRVLTDGSASSGSIFTNSRLGYDEYRPGGLLRDSSLQQWSLQLNQFVATFRADGSPADYVAHTTFTPSSGGKPRPVDIKVNSPLSAGSGVEIYLLNHGYAPVFQLHNSSGAVVQTSAPVICAPIDSRNLLSTCVVSFGDLPPDPKTGAPADLAFDIELAPTGSFTAGNNLISTYPTLRKPIFAITPFVGDLGDPANVESLDPRGLSVVANKVQPLAPGVAGLSSINGLPGGFSLTVEPDIHQWASFQVKRDPAKKLVLLAAIGIVAGLLLSLRIRRRRLWIRAVPAAAGAGPGEPGGSPRRTLVEIGGLARSDAASCREELDRIVSALKSATGTIDDMPSQTAEAL